MSRNYHISYHLINISISHQKKCYISFYLEKKLGLNRSQFYFEKSTSVLFAHWGKEGENKQEIEIETEKEKETKDREIERETEREKQRER